MNKVIYPHLSVYEARRRQYLRHTRSCDLCQNYQSCAVENRIIAIYLSEILIKLKRHKLRYKKAEKLVDKYEEDYSPPFYDTDSKWESLKDKEKNYEEIVKDLEDILERKW